MRFLILNLMYLVDLLAVAGVLVLLGAGIYSLWLDFLYRPSLIIELVSLIGCSVLAWLTGSGVLYLIRRKLEFAPAYEYWQAETALYYSQWGNATINPCLNWIVYIVCVMCFLPIYYSILPKTIFWILISILASFGIFCLSQIRFGLVQKQIQAHYLPRTQAFIDFYLASAQGEWTDELDKLIAKIDSCSTDYQVARQIRALIKHEPVESKIFYDFIDIGYGPGFDATPENIAAKREADFDSFDSSLKTPEHLG